MKLNLTPALRRKIFIALIGAGVSGPSAYIATTHTVPAEGFMLNLHMDPVGKATTCIGHLVQKGETPKKTYTEDECIALFVKDWKKHQDLVKKVVKVDYRSEWMKGAVEDFTFNKGIGNLASSTLLARLNARRYDEACEQLLRWKYGTVNGKKVVLKGLEIRANAQYKFCMGDEPADYKPTMEMWGIK